MRAKLRSFAPLDSRERLSLRGLLWLVLILLTTIASAQPRRKIIIDQDTAGPGGSNMNTLLLLLQSPQVEVLGITVVTGDQWRNEELARTLRLLEIIGRTDVPVIPGAEFPLVRSRYETQLWQERYGKVAYAGAATILGTNTAGSVAAAQVFGLPDGSGLQVTVFEILSADGKPLNKVGEESLRRRCCAFSDSDGARVSA